MSRIVVNTRKNRNREKYSFANINLLGKCNVNCFFCLGKDLEAEFKGLNHTNAHYSEWERFEMFLATCRMYGIEKIYITGQNTDALVYGYFRELVAYLQTEGFKVGCRTNGYKAAEMVGAMNQCNLSSGLSIHTLNPVTNKMIMGRSDIPDWEFIIPQLKRPRVSIVLNRCNRHEFFDLLKYIAKFQNVRYIQVRRVSTDTRTKLLMADMIAYEEVYSRVREVFDIRERLWEDAEVFDIYGKDVVFWRTIKTSVNSMNYFTDGTISDVYFVVEGYQKYKENLKWKKSLVLDEVVSSRVQVMEADNAFLLEAPTKGIFYRLLGAIQHFIESNKMRVDEKKRQIVLIGIDQVQKLKEAYAPFITAKKERYPDESSVSDGQA